MSINGLTDFGTRLAKIRKRCSFTQNELAERLAITPQAVSKWERGEGLPDVTLFPKIAEALGVSVGELFGETGENKVGASEYYEGLALVGASGDLLCYSDKTVERSDDVRVYFTDGSYADFSENTVVNCGAGEIRIIEQEAEAQTDEKRKTALDKALTPFSSLEITNNFPCNIEILPSEDGEYRIHAEGSAKFISLIETSFASENLLRVRIKSANGVSERNSANLLVIYAGFEKGEQLSLMINGSGNLKTEFCFQNGSFQINGSGHIQCDDFGERLSAQINGSGNVNAGNIQTHTVIQINGSGNVTCGSFGEMLSAQINGSGDISGESAGTATIKIAGSGDVDIQRLTRALTAAISGSGDITCGGEIAMLELNITGAGALRGEGLTTNEAEITLKGTSGATIGRVVGKSVERISKNAKLNVLKRG